MFRFRLIHNVMMLLTIILVAMSCGTPSPSPTPAGQQNSAGDEATVRSQIAAFETAYNKRDAGALAAFFVTDGDVMIGSGSRSSGQETIRRTTQAEWARTPSTRQIDLTVDSIRFLDSDVAIAEVSARFSEGEPPQDRGTWVMARRDGSWRVAALRVLPAQGS